MSSLAYSTAPVHLPIPGDAISGVEASAGPHSKEYESLARRRDLSSSSKMLLARIASYPQGHCFAKQATLALELGLCTKQIGGSRSNHRKIYGKPEVIVNYEVS
jgi:hypothetical protein